ncbi:MAG: aminopeptidase [Bacillota bacterium]
MADHRVEKLAHLLVNYSLKLKKGDKLLIEASTMALPLVQQVYKEALIAGAHPDIHSGLDGIKELLFTYGSEEQIGHVSVLSRATLEDFDAVLTIWGEQNPKELFGIDSKKISMHRSAKKDLLMKFYRKIATGEVRWCGTLFPGHGEAQEAGMSLREYENFVYGAGLMNTENPTEEWRKISKQQQKICDYLNTKKKLHIVSKDTDIQMEIEGRKWINCDGEANFPDGEVFTTPIRESVNGTIRFTYPAIYSGKEVEDVRLTFKDGKVIEASAAKGEEFLISMLDTDEGARYVGEIAIGTNYGIQRFTKNILFDEKIGGTVHLAVGAGLEETGGHNESAVHWDMICDMRDDGKIYVDDELIYENGKFIIEF